MVIRLGIIGLSTDPSAWATMAHIKPLTEKPLSDHYKLTALATSSKTTANAAAKTFGLPEEKAYDSAEALAQDEDVDMVTVSIKVLRHYQAILPALKAKKSVYVEWPLAATTEQAIELLDLAKKEGLRTVVCLQARANPTIQTVKKIIDSGALGKILTSTVNASASMLTDAPEKYYYLNDPTSGANLVSIPLLHTLDPLCYLLGEFKWLSSVLSNNFPDLQFTRKDGTKTEAVPRKFQDAIMVQGILESGANVSATLTMTTKATPERLEWIIAGEKATLKMEADSASVQMASLKLSMYEPPASPDGKGAWKVVEPLTTALNPLGVGEVYQAFAENNPAPLVDFEEAVKRHRMVDAIFRSNDKGSRESY